MTTLTPTEADRHLDAAEARMDEAKRWHDAYARNCATYSALEGPSHRTAIAADLFLIARAAELEARADWDDARRLRAKVRNGAQMDSWQGRWVA